MNVAMRKANPTMKSLVSVGGWNFNDCNINSFGQGTGTCEIFSTIAKDVDKTKKFAANIIEFCRKWGFDGFDLDWEYPVVAGHNTNQKENGAYKATPEDYTNYIRMLRVLKEEFHKEADPKYPNPLLITAAVGIGESTVETAYDIAGMAQQLDLINLMTYDFHGAWESKTGCNAPLYSTAEDKQLGGYSVSEAIDQWLREGAVATKLTIGLGSYGRGWKLGGSATGFNAPASGGSTPGTCTKEAGYFAYYEIMDKLQSGAMTATYDSARGCVYAVGNGEWTGYDNEKSICEKIKFAKTRGLAGSMWWALDLDDMDGTYSGGVTYPLTRIASTAGSTCAP